MTLLEEAGAYYLDLGRRYEAEIMAVFRDLGGAQEFVYVEAVAHRFTLRQPRPAPVNHLRRAVLSLFADLTRSGRLEARQDPGTEFVTRRAFRARSEPVALLPAGASDYRRSRLSPLATRSQLRVLSMA